MTNEEVIKVFETWIERDKKMKDADRLENIEIYNIAIQALKQQPCEDCISREAVRELICQNNDKYGYSDRFHEFTEKCLHLPSVTPQRMQGEWIEVFVETPNDPYNYGFKTHKCSKCEYRPFQISDYCPNCGAEMEDKE